MSFVSNRHRQLVLILIACAAALVPAIVRADPNDPIPEWTHLVPADARMYVEFRELSVIRYRLQHAGIWQVIRDLGQPDAAAASQAWQQRTEETLGLSIEQTITVLLATRTSLFATDPTRWSRGVVLAEVGNVSIIPELLKRWHALRREPIGPVARYELPTGLLVAQRDRLLLFGPVSDDDGLWSRAVLLLAGRGGPTLASLPEFSELSGDLPADFDGFIYVKGRPLDRLLGPRDDAVGADPVLLASIKVKADDISMELRTRPAPAQSPSNPTSQPVAPLLPADSMLVWSGRIDVASRLRPAAESQPFRSFGLSDVLPRAVGLLADFGKTTIEAIADRATIVIGRDAPGNSDDFEQPAIAIVLDTHLPFQAGSAMDGIVMLTWQWAVANSPGLEQSVKPTFDRKELDDIEIHTFALGTMLARRTKCPFFRRLQLSWAAVDRWLVVSTSENHVERIVNSVLGRAPRLRDSAFLRDEAAPLAADSDWMFARGTSIAAMLKSWLDYLRSHEPAALEPAFWADWAARRIEKEHRLGVGLRPVKNRQAEAEIIEIIPGSPADGWLRVGDVIVSAENAPLTTSQPAREVADRFRRSRAQSAFMVGIRRAGHTMTIGVPIEPSPLSNPGQFDPIAAVKIAIALAEHIDILTVQRRTTAADRFSARILIRWPPKDSPKQH